MRPKSKLTAEEKKQKQKEYLAAFRDKQRRLKELNAQLDAVVTDLEIQPKCEACRAARLDCRHTHVRSVLGLQTDSLRHEIAKLEQPARKGKRNKS